MTIDFITGKAGTDHIDGNDWRSINASIIGLDDYVMRLRNELAIRVQDSNHVVIDTGMAMLNGGAAHVTAAETVTIQSGTQGQKRNDLVCLRYTKTGDIEKASLVCIKGTPTTGTPADPSYNKASTLLGSTTVHDMPLYRLPLNGITLGTPVKLFRTLDSLASVWDSLTQTVIWTKLADSSDTVSVTGTVVNGVALMRVFWMNNGSFMSPSWKRVNLARMVNFKTNGEGYDFICSENTGSDVAGSGIIGVQNQDIYWQHTGGQYEIPKQQRHQAALIFPVLRV